MKEAEKTAPRRDPQQLPTHIGVIMDGNGRWAKKRGLPRTAGHKAGAETFKRIVIYAGEIGIRYFTVYAFSTENWRRPAAEVNALILLFEEYLQDAINHFSKRNMRVRFLGETEVFPQRLRDLIHTVEEESRNRTGMTLNICLNYGGRCEITDAVRKLAAQVQSGALKPEQIDEKAIAQNLYYPDEPDADLIIRPSGEYRISNFLLWQSAYAELVFMNVLWPDFTPEMLDRAIEEYQHRSRRFGGV